MTEMPKKKVLSIAAPTEHHAELAKASMAGFEALKAQEEKMHRMLNTEPRDVFVLFYMGTLQMLEQHYGQACATFERIMSLDMAFPEALNNCGNSYKELQRNELAEKYFRQAWEASPHADFANNLATLQINAGEPEQAEYWSEEALKLDPTHKQAKWNLTLSHLERGWWEKGFDGYHWGYRTGGRFNRQFDAPFWDGKPTKRMVVYGEQGLGDELMFWSQIPDLLESGLVEEVIIDCHPRLETSLKRTFGDDLRVLGVYGTRKIPGPETPWFWKHYPYTAKAGVGDLCQYFRRQGWPGTPYVKLDEKKVRYWRSVFQQLKGDKTGPVIAISWAGGTVKTNSMDRTIPLPEWMPIFTGLPQATFVSFQYKWDAALACEQFERDFDVRIHHNESWADPEDADDIMSALAGVDRLISINTSLVHMAGAIGKEALVLTPHRCAWRYGVGRDTVAVWPGIPQIQQTREERDAEKTAHKRWGRVMQDAAEAMRSEP